MSACAINPRETNTVFTSNFAAAMTEDQYSAGEARYQATEPSRKLAMVAGLTRSSDELQKVWESDEKTYLTLLKGAIAAYEQNQLVEELLRGAIARLVSVVDSADPEVFEAATAIVGTGVHDD